MQADKVLMKREYTKEVANKPGYFFQTETVHQAERSARDRLCKRLGITNKQLKKRRILRNYQLVHIKGRVGLSQYEYVKTN